MPCRQFPWYNYRTHIASHLVIPKVAKWLNHSTNQKISCKTGAQRSFASLHDLQKELSQYFDTSIRLIFS